MTGFKSVSEAATAMSIAELEALISNKLSDLLAAKPASRVAKEVAGAILAALRPESISGRLMIERQGYALMPATSNNVVLKQDARELIAFIADGSSHIRRHEAKSIGMEGSRPGRPGENISMWLPMNYIELDPHKARLLAEQLMVFARSGDLSPP